MYLRGDIVKKGGDPSLYGEIIAILDEGQLVVLWTDGRQEITHAQFVAPAVVASQSVEPFRDTLDEPVYVGLTTAGVTASIPPVGDTFPIEWCDGTADRPYNWDENIDWED